ncbi:MAG: hypothetical protein QG670_2103 [Thermoproteota archaeon]|nr:hypothetical protein [Thermoproteota archaeon]
MLGIFSRQLVYTLWSTLYIGHPQPDGKRQQQENPRRAENTNPGARATPRNKTEVNNLLVGKVCRDCKWFDVYTDFCGCLKKDVKPWEDAENCEYYRSIEDMFQAHALICFWLSIYDLCPHFSACASFDF